MSENFAYKAPQYIDFEMNPFEHEDKKKIEAYFDYDHENPDNEAYYSLGPEEFYTDYADDGKRHNGFRKSLSMSCLPKDPIPSSAEDDLCKALTKANLYSSSQDICKNSRAIGSTASLNLKSNYSLRELSSKKKYVSMAEAVNNFNKRTPARYHSKPKNAHFSFTKCNGPIPSTIPQSPAFATNKRLRPVTAVSQEERELQEFEKAQKNQIRANPVNKKILQEPFKPKVPPVKKKSTAFAPFKITDVQKKPSSPRKDTVPEFHAKPVPKSVYERKMPSIKPVPCTQPITPTCLKKYSEKMKQVRANLKKEKENEKEVDNKTSKLSRTRVEPFSFEQRNQYVMKKRAEFVRKAMEEEKKMREFHARPLPKRMFKSPQFKTNRMGSLESVRSTKSDDDNSGSGSSVFKARPAKVLTMEPFVPKKEERQLIEITEFKLNTNRRALEREDYERKLQEKQQYLEEARKMREEEERQRAQEENALLRKRTEYTAQPIRHYKELPRIIAKPVTMPCSPRLSTARLRDKENVNLN